MGQSPPGEKMIKSDEEMKKIVIQFIDLFLEDYVKEFNVEFDELSFTFTEDEFNKLIGNYDSSNGVVNNGIHSDEYTYDINDMDMKKLIIDYTKTDDGKYVILSIKGFTEIKI
jgi:hypothetical protein